MWCELDDDEEERNEHTEVSFWNVKRSFSFSV